MNHPSLNTVRISLIVLLISPQIGINSLFADEDGYGKNPQSQNYKSVDGKMMRLKRIKEEEQKVFIDFDRENTALDRESTERIDAIDVNLNDQQRVIEERKIKKEIIAKKRKLIKIYKEDSRRLGKEKDDIIGIDRSAQASKDVQRRLKADSGYSTAITPSAPKPKKKVKSAGYKRREKKRNRSKISRPKRVRYNSRRNKGSY